MFLCCSPATTDVLEIIETMSINGYNFVAPEIVE